MIKKTLATLLALFAAAALAAVDANEASVADLDSIKGIGPGTSAKILEQRKAAKFKDWDDLVQRVSGIGDKRAAKLSAEGLTVNGTPFKASEKQTVATKTPKPLAAADKPQDTAPAKK
ncbi:MAG: helix-hairpin-helix domain-containing protein [Hydrogenophaga sp.]|jgi:competence protein ComEA|uniref:ComEA family DNA-binding protein n=1 Tax=Hydrogenophaga sp. TaxID=1904254 RepID=UPI00272537CE|nr:helix-hairpin-helix domain-containing protein [Hydrogenophaga sp.]MDO9203153.1 helix-hairpin-helix domain-containing protein [Hydrogenophaga sp.]MDO9479298.1 helix-hairpin-helix domain-containing protein [Hydrogenophaga sp.]MDO9570236.1 helix-hairpin-helix domain-containing protein [Hydrogenophaga sp.]MDP1892666.1 helix-hairpin-helix domain-containing protein [Hydrogenophaga sp.]MDP2094788.1 helix-hairpin-helix domain-containing protein [Hydrogenophaga sp.]